MKKKFSLVKLAIMIALSICVFSTSASAQRGASEFKSVVGVSPFTLWHGLRVKYENVLTPKLTAGGLLTGYYGGVCPGVQLAPIGRFYLKGAAPEGFYLQAKFVSGVYFNDVNVYNVDNRISETKKYAFTSFGGGVACGYQILWGKNDKWSIDLNLGFKFVGPIKDYKYKENESSPSEFDGLMDDVEKVGSGLGWYMAGPGSIFDGLLSIGYRF
jgi:hypothetical protein